MQPLIPIEKVEVFFDGLLTEPKLNHPEGLAFDAEGNLWCGGEDGEIFRIDPEGKRIELIAETGGFCLGMAFDRGGNLYICDLKKSAVFKLDTRSRQISIFADGNDQMKLTTPNFPVVDHERGCLYVSSSNKNGPGIWKFDLRTGEGGLWYDQPLGFANGMALSLDNNALYVAETFDHRISKIPVDGEGKAGRKEIVAEVEALPDGLAVDSQGRIYVSCYEPSQVLRIGGNGEVELVAHDPEAHTFCHPTNCAFFGDALYASNLGRWHITKVPVGTTGKSLL
ncbi:SMP-30/gluconolactonase/LRE family protein [Paenibacillus cisolokensis]|uniref:SMP-30/gluconolactonase/LRE family protein n=1 Tax=Paenibacillus cisolokensis TaxID=1658519 RepID=UPI003D2BB526